MPLTSLLYVRTSMLDIAYETHGPLDGEPVILLHGFPYDPRAYDAIAPVLAERGYRVLVPYLRGYGPTRFIHDQVMRSGQQAALAKDLLDFMDALAFPRVTLAGYDWGGRAACIVAALWPQRVRALVSGDGYNIQNIPQSISPRPPETEHRLWYQYYFHTQRGIDGLTANRRELCELLWALWSPTWAAGTGLYGQTAPSFDNPDFVEVVIHSYRHRFMYAPGDPALEWIEQALARQPTISVPSISLCGADDGVGPPPEEDEDAARFSGFYQRQVLPGVGHNIPQEAPQATLDALQQLLDQTDAQNRSR
ncbi:MULTISPECIES: alpha/beta fold hydrolase [Pseudomonas]|jgi:pimeloyl-ACP methyl ester carboxylesterase|uniref:Alpha/beta hydrolase n=1 Tax=Pseudomonas quebecensis TaxID=2995174 RepID=A0ABY6QAB5_9PSED|nr:MULTISPECIES: alpha/beta hydrolase [Pseudomonas]MCP1510486.1 pimeloyl-ACP methyl ester carboxylesterase [Pseudomonas rhodesiae]MCX4066791.1 alpha/beta hydrolase [Pseudomonas quebecensis]MDF9769297.1 pimeloyl-ACP methyl ester carboxylesterase [Pseudomonas rhodesiae]UZW16720.1 alpha/beta hydrolase [Pseudomonas quebecensis]UZW25866.1 alpha/beta hydrolase [Pseudomonas quebecensis]